MSLLSDLGTYLQTNNLGTVNTDLFVAPHEIPDSPDLMVCLYEYSWSPTDLTFDRKGDIRKQIRAVVRSGKLAYSTGQARAEDIHDLLHGLSNTTVGSTAVKSIRALTHTDYLAEDRAGRPMWTVSFGVVFST